MEKQKDEKGRSGSNKVDTEVLKKRKLFSRLSESISASVEHRRANKELLVWDIAIFLIGFLFARCHVIFGAHPLALAFIAVLPHHVWIAALGSAIGSLTLGGAGIIYAMIAIILVFLRIIISGTGEKDKDGAVFRENLVLRMSVAIIGGFITAVYEALLNGFTMNTALFGASMILIPPLVTLSLSGLFGTGLSAKAIIYDSNPVFSARGVSDKERYALYFYQGSALVIAFFLGLSLGQYELFGISVAYIFAGVVTLFVAKRFGALRAVAIGFVSMLGLSSAYSVAYALLGLAAGLLFKIGISYAIVGGGALLIGWSAYAGGVIGLVTTLPEYLISAIIVSPLIGRLPTEKTESEAEIISNTAEDMVGTVALAYKNKYSGSLDALELSLVSLSSTLSDYAKRGADLDKDDLRELILECIGKYCRSCTLGQGCDKRMQMPEEELDRLSTIIYNNRRLTLSDFNTPSIFCGETGGLIEAINRAVIILEEEEYKGRRSRGTREEMELVSRLISEARHRDAGEKQLNEELSSATLAALDNAGLSGGAVKVYGKRIPHFIVAAEDPDGKRIGSPELLEEISSISGRPLTAPSYYRRGRMALLECSAEKMFSIECATAMVAGERDPISGDTANADEGQDGFFHILISDGMGCGKEAKETSEFLSKFMFSALPFGSVGQSLLGILNRTLRTRKQECSATMDLFSFDLYTGEGFFIKCGAAPSFVKRGSSIFRLSSRTAPLGLIKNPDAEKIKADIKDGDYVIMLSDGVTGGVDDAPWLIELLSRAPKKTPKDYASHILSAALKNQPHTDDMTVAVAKITRI